MIRVLDPTNETKAAGIEPAPRLPSLKGKTVGFISNGKEGTKAYFVHVERLLREELGVEPDAKTTALLEQIEHGQSGTRLPKPILHLPTPSTPFINRPA